MAQGNKHSQGTKFSIQQTGIDYFINILKHIDRMSEGLIKESVDVGKIGTKALVGYYEQILHLEALLTPFLTKEYYEKRKDIISKIPDYHLTWSSEIKDQIEFFNAIVKLFRFLILISYKQGVLKIKMLPQWRMDDDIL